MSLGERTAYYSFGEDGKAFTGGYKEVTEGEKTDYYYYLPNGQAYTSGYKTVKIDGVTYYYFFEQDGKAFTGGEKEIAFGSLSFLYCFGENGQALAGQFAEKNGETVYYAANGRKVADDFATVDDSIYFFDENGAMQKATWFVYEDGCYYAQENGQLLTDAVKEGYRLDETGKCSLKYRVLEHISEYTEETMTREEKIRALFDSVLLNDWPYIGSYEHVLNDWTWEEGWTDDFATDLLDRCGGNCFRYAAFFGFLVKESTGL